MSAIAPESPIGSSLTARITAALIAGAAVFVCFPAIEFHSFLWSTSDYFGHAYAIPVVAALFAYERRRAILRALRNLEPPVWGPAVAFMAFSFQVLMSLGDVRFAAGLGVPLVLAATAYAIGGTALLRPLALPVGFLALMVPPPGSVTDVILSHLKLVVTESAVRALRFCGFPVLATGNEIEVPGYTLFVADACSGLISIITLIPLAAIVAVYLGRGIWRRVAIVASVIPVAMLANILRVTVTIAVVSFAGTAFAEGALHQSFGLATSVLGTLAMVAVARGLR